MMKQNINTDDFDQNYYFYCSKPESVTPDAFVLFQFYDVYFFQKVLEACELKWSKRMTSCAGTCKHSSYNSCTITLSEALLQFRNTNELKETLLHEMIHAYLFLTNPKACLEDGGHGEEFQTLMHFINSITGLNITIYHSFIDEVESFRKHVWKCNGPCATQPPFYGICKRQMNRPPQKSDRWFDDHQKNCGGQFIKIDGPEFGEDGKVDPSKLAVKKTKKEKIEKLQETNGGLNNKKQKKGEPKVDNLQSLISKFLITSPEQAKQNTNSMNQSIQGNNSKSNQDNYKFQTTNENSTSSGGFSLDNFVFQKKQYQSNFLEDMKQKYEQKNQNSTSKMLQEESQSVRQSQKLITDQQRFQQQQQKIFKNNGFLNEELISKHSNSNGYSNQQNFHIADKELEIKQQRQQTKVDFYSTTQSLKQSNTEETVFNIQIQPDLQEFQNQTLCQIKISIAFSRDPSLKNKSQYIYLINANTKLLIISELLQKLYGLDESKIFIKHVISEINGRDDKIDNFPFIDLLNFQELFKLLFDYGSIKIYVQEIKRMEIQKEQIQSSKLFQNAINTPIQQQIVNLKQ